jgi:hypothetical protein
MHATIALKATAVAAIFGLMAVSAAIAAPVMEVAGTKADVRAYCKGDRNHLIEAESYALCVGDALVICKDDGTCVSTDMTFGSRESEVAAH